MAQTNRLLIVNFGQAYASLATVGYTVYTRTGTTSIARATTGVFELGTATGIYAVNASVDQGFDGIVLFDTGGASPRYAVQENSSQLNSIQNETDTIRIIWNTLRNQGDFFTRLSDKVDKLKNIIEGLGEIVVETDKKSELKIEDIKKALTITVNAPDVTVPAPVVHLPAPIVNIPETKIPEIIIPNYSNLINQIKTEITMIKNEIKNSAKDSQLKNMIDLLTEAEKNIRINSDDKNKKILVEVEKIKTFFTKLDSVLVKMAKLDSDLKSLETNDKELIKGKDSIRKEIRELTNYIINPTGAKENMDVLMSFGHIK